MRILAVLMAAVLSGCGASHKTTFLRPLDTPSDQVFIENRCEADTKNSVPYVDRCNDAASLDAYRRDYENYRRDYNAHR